MEFTWFVVVPNKPESRFTAERKNLGVFDIEMQPVSVISLISRLVNRVDTKVRSVAAVHVVALSLLGILADYALAPALNTVTPAVAVFLLLFLLLRTRGLRTTLAAQQELASLKRVRILVFLLLHAVIVLFLRRLEPTAAPAESILASASKYLVLAPAVVLWPCNEWRRFDHSFRAEWVAAAIALVTFYPYRIFASVWPWYSQDLARAAYFLARPFVDGLHLLLAARPVLQGPELDVQILFACSGLSAVKLLQVIFLGILVVDWPDMNHVRVFLAYCSGLAVMLLANVLRISLMVIAGNNGMWQFTLRHHITAGWIFFAAVAAAGLWCSEPWLKGARASAPTRVGACRQEIA